MASTNKQETTPPSEQTPLVHPDTSNDSSPNVVAFFLLTFLLAMPLYILTVLAYFSILGKPELAGLYVAMVTVTPMLSSSILTRKANVKLGVFYSRCFHVQRDKSTWYMVALCTGPLVFVLSYVLIKLILGRSHLPIEIPSSMVPLTPLTIPVVFFFCFLLASGEEIGWMGYAYDTMQTKWCGGGALPAALVLGILWACWHLPFFLCLFPSIFVWAQVFILVANRVVACWIYNNTEGNVLAVIVYHAADNTAFTLLPDIKEVHPWGPAMLTIVNIAVAMIVILIWNSQTLTQCRSRRRYV